MNGKELSSAKDGHVTIEASGLKFETREDLLQYVDSLLERDVEEVHLSGNTYGVDACRFLGEILLKKKSLKVFYPHSN